MRRWLIGAVLGLLAGCAAYDGADLARGRTTVSDIEQRMGPPAMRWREADGGETLAYPRGPQGFHTWFVRVDAAGTFVSRQNVLDTSHFARIRLGMSGDEVLRILGPSVPQWTAYFAARDELVWEWRYCDDWNEPARFDVLFDATSGRVRSTLAATEQMRGFGMDGLRSWCSR